MDKKIQIYLGVVLAVVLCAVAFLSISLYNEKANNNEMQELAELDKQEMQKEIANSVTQYGEMRTMITNDSLIAQLLSEQQRAEKLMKELESVKSTNGREILRLKKEIATLREVLRGYVVQIDSLNRLNENLTAENTRIQGQYEEATKQIEGMKNENMSLSEKVAVAAQLNAVRINMTPLTKKGKVENNVKKCKQLKVDFSISRNVTAECGQKNVYVRITTPTGAVLDGGGAFSYENRQLQYSMKKTIDYNGEDTPVVLFWDVKEAHSAGTYQVAIFVDNQMIGSRSVAVK